MRRLAHSLSDHITEICPLADSLYQSLFNSSSLFGQIQDHLGRLSSVLKATENITSDYMEDNEDISSVLKKCYDVLVDFSQMKQHFDSGSRQTQISWERMTSVHVSLGDLEERLSSYIQTLKLLNCSIIEASQTSIDDKLKKLIDEMRTRSGSTVSDKTNDSLDLSGREAWRDIRKELQEIGITPKLFAQHRDFITKTLRAYLDQEDRHDEHVEDLFLVQARLSQPGTLHITSIQKPQSTPQSQARKPSQAVSSIRKSRFIAPDSPLGAAIKDGQTKIVESLLDEGADVNARCTLWSIPGTHHIIDAAAERGHKEIVRLLLDRGATDRKDHALTIASQAGKKRMVKFLIERGANLNSDLGGGYTVLARTIKWNGPNSPEMVKLLLDSGASFHPVPPNALERALRQKKDGIIRFWMEYVEKNKCTGSQGWEILGKKAYWKDGKGGIGKLEIPRRFR